MLPFPFLIWEENYWNNNQPRIENVWIKRQIHWTERNYPTQSYSAFQPRAFSFREVGPYSYDAEAQPLDKHKVSAKQGCRRQYQWSIPYRLPSKISTLQCPKEAFQSINWTHDWNFSSMWTTVWRKHHWDGQLPGLSEGITSPFSAV